MVILGLGTNIGDRLANLRAALVSIKKITGLEVLQVSPVYWSQALLPDNAPAYWDYYFLNVAIRCQTNLDPFTLLEKMKTIEQQLGRDLHSEKWSPRIIDIDLLAWDDRIIEETQLNLPHSALLHRPFALWPLADIAPTWRHPTLNKIAAELIEPWGSRYSKQAPFQTHQIAQRIDTPELMGIINITADSFSDGGKFLNVDHAIQQAIDLTASGATILDIGAESTAPNAKPISNAEEWSRLEPVLSMINTIKTNSLISPKISLDTRHPAIAEKALNFSIDWFNDVSGLTDPVMQHIVKSANKKCVIMHHLRIPEDRNFLLSRDLDIIETILDWARTRLSILEQAGLDLDNLIFDPGIGFGKTPEQQLTILQRVSELTTLRLPLLIGHSRKSFMMPFTSKPAPERDLETTIISTCLAKKPIDYLRIHNVDMVARALRTLNILN